VAVVRRACAELAVKELLESIVERVSLRRVIGLDAET